MVGRRRSTIVTTGGRSAASGNACSRRWPRRGRARRTVGPQPPCEGAPLGSRRKKGEYEEAIGRSWGRLTCKIHGLADNRGRPAAIALTPGNVADIAMAIPLLGAAAPSGGCSPTNAVSSRSTRIPAKERHRTVVRAAEKLATHRHALRSPCKQLSYRNRSRRYPHRVEQMSPQQLGWW